MGTFETRNRVRVGIEIGIGVGIGVIREPGHIPHQKHQEQAVEDLDRLA